MRISRTYTHPYQEKDVYPEWIEINRNRACRMIQVMFRKFPRALERLLEEHDDRKRSSLCSRFQVNENKLKEMINNFKNLKNTEQYYIWQECWLGGLFPEMDFFEEALQFKVNLYGR
jgi:thiaminase